MNAYRSNETGSYRLDLLRRAINKAHEDAVIGQAPTVRLLAWLDEPETREALGLPHPASDQLLEWQYAICDLCGYPITAMELTVITEGERGSWLHVDPETNEAMVYGGRGCRSASFDRGSKGWDKGIPDKWKAAPRPGTNSNSGPEWPDGVAPEMYVRRRGDDA